MKRVNRFLLCERYEPKDLFDEVKLKINLVGGTLSGWTLDKKDAIVIILFFEKIWPF